MQRKTSKAKYRLRNWREYNAALIRRGSLTLWVSEETLRAWHDAARPGKRGAPRTYSDVAISGMASLSAVYRLALPATQGLAFFGAETAQGGTAGANLYDLVSAAPEACSESIAARQLHLGVDEASREILAAVATTNELGDGQLLPELLDQLDEQIVQGLRRWGL